MKQHFKNLLVVLSIGTPFLCFGQWNKINDIRLENQKLIMVDSLEGYIGTSYGLYQTLDGWLTVKNILPDFFVRGFDVAPDGSLACTGVDLVYMEMGYRVSSNQGNSWQKHNNSIMEGHSEIRFFGVDSLFAQERGKYASFSYDGGRTWQIQLLDSGFSSVSDVTIINKSNFLLSVKTFMNRKKNIFKSNDGGKTWRIKEEFDNYGVLEFEAHQNTVYGVGQNGLLVKSSDQGENWIVLPKINDYTLIKLDFIHENYGFVVGGQMSIYPLFGVIYRTVNGGLTWENVSPEGIKTSITGLDMVNENLGYAVDNNGVIYKTTNGGGPAKSDSVPKYGKDGKLWDGTNGGNPTDTTTNPTDTSNNGSASGVSNFINDNLSLEIFPNPTTRTVYLSEMTDLAVYNAEGQRLKVFRNTNQIDVSNLPAGMYFLHLQNLNLLIL